MAGLAEYPVTAVLRAEDLSRAKRFYTEVLGLKLVEKYSSEGEIFLEAGAGSMMTIYARPGMPAPQNTTLGFGIPAEKFDGVVSELRGSGVVFEEYDIPEIGLKTVNGVADDDGNRIAWFLDTEGNIINIGSM